jgi:uncharacterized membrane protein YfcA
MFDPIPIALGTGVGLLVGLTGVGGGALLTPLLVLVAGVRPLSAIGTDLAFAALTKLAGGWLHARRGGADLRLVGWLAGGSAPGALLGARLVDALTASVGGVSADAILSRLLGAALLAAAAASLWRAVGRGEDVAPARAPGPAGAVVIGLGIGLLVGVTSVGAGSLLMAVFALRYALPARLAVGTDVVHGAVLAAVAAVAHSLAGRIEVALLANLLVGSVPGVLLGRWLCGWLPQRPLRLAIAALLAVTGLRLL